MSAISSATNGQPYFKAFQTQASTNTAALKKPQEASGTRNNDGTYGSRHTIQKPPAADQAQELAAAQVLLSV